jgi:hypothetical protein
MSLTFNLEVTVLSWRKKKQQEYANEKNQTIFIVPLSNRIARLCRTGSSSRGGWSTGWFEFHFQCPTSAASIFRHFGKTRGGYHQPYRLGII